MAELRLRGIRKSYGEVEVIGGIDLDVDDREFVVFVGPSGCGKSTLLRMIAGLEKISGGELTLDGERVNDVGPSERGLAMVFQSYALYPHMTVAENMGFALKIAGLPAAERQAKVEAAAAVLQLTPLLQRRPKELSGGQRQRVAIGRAIVREPKVFLFDEPLSNLDAALRVNMRLELMRLHKQLAATMVYVTHDQVEAMTMADKIVVLNAGRIEQVGSPLDLYHRPVNAFVAEFMGSPKMNMLSVTVISAGPGGVVVGLPGGGELPLRVSAATLARGDAVRLGIRPEHIRFAANGQMRGEAVLAERLGSLTILHVDVDSDTTIVVQTEGADATPIGSRVGLAFDPAHGHLFATTGEVFPPLD